MCMILPCTYVYTRYALVCPYMVWNIPYKCMWYDSVHMYICGMSWYVCMFYVLWCTLWMKSVTMFSIYMHLIHQYRGKCFSCLIFLQFSHCTVEIWKKSRLIKNIGQDAYLQNFHAFEILWRISQVLLVQKYNLLDFFVF